MANLHRRLLKLERAQPQCCATCAALVVRASGEASCALDDVALAGGSLAPLDDLTRLVCRLYLRSHEEDRLALFRRLAAG